MFSSVQTVRSSFYRLLVLIWKSQEFCFTTITNYFVDVASIEISVSIILLLDLGYSKSIQQWKQSDQWGSQWSAIHVLPDHFSGQRRSSGGPTGRCTGSSTGLRAGCGRYAISVILTVVHVDITIYPRTKVVIMHWGTIYPRWINHYVHPKK